ncbi:MAG: hypothetical protein U0105_14295 [Candidatus Obscuribacterales bacterium]
MPKEGAPKKLKKLIRYPIFLTALALTGGILWVNRWIDSDIIPTNQQDEQDWSRQVAKMAPLEANLLQLRLQLREARDQRWRPDLAGNTRAVQGLFFLSRGDVATAIKTLETAADEYFKSTDHSSMELAIRQDVPHNFAGMRRVSVADMYIAPSEWRWKRLCKLYLGEKRYDKAARLMDKILIESGSDREVSSGDMVALHELALEVYTSAGQKAKAEAEQKVLKTSGWIPRNCSITQNVAQAHADLRTETFQYGLSLMHAGRGQEAADVFKQLAYDEYSVKHRTDDPDFLASTHMMIPVALVSVQRWDEAQKYFPRALRLAEKQGITFDIDARTPLWRAYATLLHHQGKASEAGKYLDKIRKQPDFPIDVEFISVDQPAPIRSSDSSASALPAPTPSKFDDADLYAPEPGK